MYFYDESHEINFQEMLNRFPSAVKDKEYRVGCYIAAHPEIFFFSHAQKEWDYIFDEWTDTEDFSHGIKLLIDLGIHLYGGGRHPFNLLDGLSVWDSRNIQVFKQAVEIRK